MDLSLSFRVKISNYLDNGDLKGESILWYVLSTTIPPRPEVMIDFVLFFFGIALHLHCIACISAPLLRRTVAGYLWDLVEHKGIVHPPPFLSL